jgi:hypothetical protein
MERIKITVSGSAYGSRETYILPPVENTAEIAAALARAAKASSRQVGSGYDKPSILVTDPTSSIDVQIIDEDGVMTRKQHAEAHAAAMAEEAAQKSKAAAVARREADAVEV